ncbi:right-handed parallel beta-helix repeat-containing protein [Paenibacillus sp. EC2-1]|uniref:right-handed parallel beta-helix repeat-containing protein n=1 Tax=Paenibacillus sp. EC2-1 TaxID=3388665 RepID=UPI003BEF28D2
MNSFSSSQHANDCLQFYISTEGRDHWSGTLAEPNDEQTDGPFATIGKARDAVRSMKESEKLPESVTVWLREGEYTLTEVLTFRPQDSASVTYAAYPGETPVISGGKRITGWREEAFGSQKVWVVDIPEVAEGNWYFRQLFISGQRRPRTRLPKQGFFWMQEVPGINVHEEGKEGGLFDGSDTFVCRSGDIEHWRNLTDVDVVAVHFWIEERMPIEAFDKRTGTVKSSRRSMFALRDDVAKRYAKYYVDNVFEALSEPGEWYLDRDTGKLYYIPMPGESLEDLEAYAGGLDQFLRLEGEPDKGQYVEHIQFKRITFRYSDWYQPRGGGERFERFGIDFAAAPQAAFNIPGVIHMEGARYCAIEDCKIEHIGFYGIELSEGCMFNRIVGNEIMDMGAGGIKLDGSDAEGAVSCRTGNNRITDNTICSGGRVFHSAVGVLSVHSFGNVISHNHIHDLYYTGISCGWVWGYAESVSKNNIIEKNHIHHLGHGLLSDMGGIYTLGVQPGTVIRGNMIHDIEKCNYGGWAIYPDEGSSHILIENNICYNTSSQVFHEHYGRENIVRNNIFAFGREGQVSLSRAEEHTSFTFERNIVVSDSEPIFVGGYSGQMDKCGFISDLNLYWDVSGREPISGNGGPDQEARFSLNRILTWVELHDLGYDLHSIYDDPRFIALDKYDFTVQEDSPALALGFKPIDNSDVGPRPSGMRE